jgi:hypothetical protein
MSFFDTGLGNDTVTLVTADQSSVTTFTAPQTVSPA